MNWALAIDRNRKDLLRIVAGLFAVAGVGLEKGRLPRMVYLSLLSLLRPAEAAARRIIAIAARDVVPVPRRSVAQPPTGRVTCVGERQRAYFRLFDPRKRVRIAGGPGKGADIRLSVPGIAEPVFMARVPDAPRDARQLELRMRALKDALEDIPAQARRMAQARAKRLAHIWPMRPGRPPGHRARAQREVDKILSECHGLALHALDTPDTS